MQAGVRAGQAAHTSRPCALKGPTIRPLFRSPPCRATNEELELPPYLSLSTPVYSLATTDRSGRGNMSLITYCSPIALQPRKYALGLFKKSLNAEVYKDVQYGVLQILSRKHLPLFQLLGKTSGRDVDKVQQLRSMGFPITSKYGVPVLAGDHDVVICDVVHYETLVADADALYTGDLREAGLI